MGESDRVEIVSLEEADEAYRRSTGKFLYDLPDHRR